MHTSRHGPEPRIYKALIVAAQGHRKGPAYTHINQTAIKMERIRCVLQPEGKTFQEVYPVYGFAKYYNESGMPCNPKRKRSQAKNDLHIVSFWRLELYMVCLRRGFPGLYRRFINLSFAAAISAQNSKMDEARRTQIIKRMNAFRDPYTRP